MTRAIACAACLLTLATSLGGCTTVHVTEPFGQVPATLDPADWDGTWCDATHLELQPGTHSLLAGGDCVILTVVDPDAGTLDVTSPSDPGDAWRAHLRRVGDDPAAVFVSVENGSEFTLELRARREGNAVFAWDVSGETVAREIEAGRLAGRLEEGRVHVDPLAPATLDRLASDAAGFFDWTHPLVLVRVSGS
jgi:hypothetical protein